MFKLPLSCNEHKDFRVLQLKLFQITTPEAAAKQLTETFKAVQTGQQSEWKEPISEVNSVAVLE